MLSIFEAITKRLAEAWRPAKPTVGGRSYQCQCGRPVFFRNSKCLACQAQLGYEPELGEVRAIEPGPQEQIWKLHGQQEAGPLWRRCGNFDSPAGCNWLVAATDAEPLCLSCRLN